MKSGADFPFYIHELIGLDILQYTQYVEDGHTVYSGIDNYFIQSDAKYPACTIADKSNVAALKQILKIHQQGGTNFVTFCKQAAAAGVEKWTVDTAEMTCTYYDKEGINMLLEAIPSHL